MLGCVAAVMAMVSPSQPRPAVIQRTSISSNTDESIAAGSLLCRPALRTGSRGIL